MPTRIAPEITVYPPKKKGDTWIAAGEIKIGSETVFIAARVSDRFVQASAAQITRGLLQGFPSLAAVGCEPGVGCEPSQVGCYPPGVSGDPMMGIGAEITAQAVAQAAKTLTNSAALKTALDVSEFIPGIGSSVKLARAGANLATGVERGDPSAVAILQTLLTSSQSGDPSAARILEQLQVSQKAIGAVRAAMKGQPEALADLMRIDLDARKGIQKAVDAKYAVEAARDSIMPDVRDEMLDTSYHDHNGSGSLVDLDALSMLRGIGAMPDQTRFIDDAYVISQLAPRR